MSAASQKEPMDSSERDKQEIPAKQLLPTGYLNDGNTCFLNSVVQSIVHTPSMHSLLSQQPSSPAPLTLLDKERIPSMMADKDEYRETMPLACAFVDVTSRAWRIEENGKSVSGKGLSLRHVLGALGNKYDQYQDYAQQDAHEAIRHLLDAMRMEELDVIKLLKGSPASPVRQPELEPKADESSSQNNEAELSSDLSPVSEVPPSAVSPSVTFNVQEPSPVSTAPPSISEVKTDDDGHPENMASFVDLIFGGRLASMIVCETCKSVSHTYEDFMDLSLSLPQEEARERKRDKLKAMAQRIRRNTISKREKEEREKEDESALASDDDEDNDSNQSGQKSGNTSRAGSFSLHGSLGGGGLSRNSSLSGLGRSGSTRRKDSTSGGGDSSSGGGVFRRGSIFGRRKKSNAGESEEQFQSRARRESESQPSTGFISRRGSDAGGNILSGGFGGFEKMTPTSGAAAVGGTLPPSATEVRNFPKLHPSQAAYIHRILGGPQVPGAPSPLSILKATGIVPSPAEAAEKGWLGLGTGQTGLMDSLRQFTAVEVLEGENAFACKKCWRWEHPRADGKPWKRGGEGGVNDDDDEEEEENAADATALDEEVETLSSAAILQRKLEQLEVSSERSGSPGLVSPSLSFATLDSPSMGIAELEPAGGSLLTSSAMAVPEHEELQISSPLLVTEESSSNTDQRPPAITRNSEGGTEYQDDDEDGVEKGVQPPRGRPVPTYSVTAASSPSISRRESVLGAHLTPLTSSTESGLRPTNMNKRGKSYTTYTNPIFASDPVSDADSDASDAEGASDVSDNEVASLAPSDSSPSTSARPKYSRKKSTNYILRRAFKRYLVVHPPPVLVFQMKRFEQIKGMSFGAFGTFASNFRKVETYVSFPEVMDMAPFLAPARVGAPVTKTNSSHKSWTGKTVVDEVLYKLCGLVVHIGSMGQGHYISYVLSNPGELPVKNSWMRRSPSPSRTPLPSTTAPSHLVTPAYSSPALSTEDLRSGSSAHSNTSKENLHQKDTRVWYCCSDTDIEQVPVEEVLSQRAYLLFYERF